VAGRHKFKVFTMRQSHRPGGWLILKRREAAMNNLLILIPVALGLGVAGLAAFIWSLKSGQYDDLDGAAERILEDDPEE
jgi:cbb3-type cytochrome oxidase maturation protein